MLSGGSLPVRPTPQGETAGETFLLLKGQKMDLASSLALLKAERIKLLADIDSQLLKLRSIKAARENVGSVETQNRLDAAHRRALAYHSRLTHRLIEVKDAITSLNIRVQEESRIQAKRDRAARKAQRSE